MSTLTDPRDFDSSRRHEPLLHNPDHAKVTIDGDPKTVFDIRKGMNLEATTVTDDTQTVIERNKSVVGQAPAPPATPREAVFC